MSQAEVVEPIDGIPVPSSTKPYWRHQPHILDSHRSTPELPKSQEIVIIGAGFAGSACAYYISRGASPMPSTTVLEAREICSGATARNGGHLRPEAHATFSAFGSTLGNDVANEIALFELANSEAVKDLVRAEKIDCDLTEVTSANVYLDDGLAQAARQRHEELPKRGYAVLETFNYHGIEEAEEVTGVKGAKAALTFSAATVWPYKLVTSLLALAVDKGVNIQTNTPVVSISSSPNADGYWTLSTPRGETKAKQIVFATNGYTRHLLPEYGQAITPVRGICSHIKTATDKERSPAIAKTVRTMGIKYGPGHQDYLMSRPDGSIVVGGAWKVVRPGPREDWYGVLDDSKLVPIAENYYDGFMNRTFGSWKDEPSTVDYLWTGIMGYTADSRPHIGKVDEGKPGMFVCAGFNGHGMPQVLLCAKGTVEMLLDGTKFADTGVPLVFETSAERRAGAKGS